MRRLILLGVVVWTLFTIPHTRLYALLAKTCLDTFHHGDSACAGYNSAITITGNATNKSGGRNDFIEIVKADGSNFMIYYITTVMKLVI